MFPNALLFSAHKSVCVCVHVFITMHVMVCVCVYVCVCARARVSALAFLLVLHSHLVSGQSSEPLEGTWPACSPGSASPCQPPHLAWPTHREREQIAQCSQKQSHISA